MEASSADAAEWPICPLSSYSFSGCTKPLGRLDGPLLRDGQEPPVGINLWPLNQEGSMSCNPVSLLMNQRREFPFLNTNHSPLTCGLAHVLSWRKTSQYKPVHPEGLWSIECSCRSLLADSADVVAYRLIGGSQPDPAYPCR